MTRSVTTTAAESRPTGSEVPIMEWSRVASRPSLNGDGADEMRMVMAAVAAIVMALGTAVFTAGPAAALGSETYGCRISPGPAGPYNGSCSNSPQYAGPYSAGFVVGGAASDTTYTWQVPAGYRIGYGCTTTSSGCRIDGLSSSQDAQVRVAVTLNQAGQTRTLATTAYINAVCGKVYC